MLELLRLGILARRVAIRRTFSFDIGTICSRNVVPSSAWRSSSNSRLAPLIHAVRGLWELAHREAKRTHFEAAETANLQLQ